MPHSFTHGSPARRKIFILLIISFSLGQMGFSQMSITGPTCVVAGTQYVYTIGGNWTVNTHMVWSISGGTFSGNNSGTPFPQVHVTWTAGANRYIGVSTTNPSSNPGFYVAVSAALQAGAISNPSQSINYNATPSTINCPVATGGACGSATYNYQWQQSTNNVTYSNISGATSQNLSFSGGLSQTTYYRRMVTVSGSGNTGYSNVATVLVYPPIQPGGISPSAQSVNYGSGATLQSTGVSGGTGNYTYRWLSSSAPTGFGVIAGATGATYSPSNLTATTYYQVEVTSGGAVAYSSVASVTVYPQLQVSAITPASQYVPYNTNSANISVSASGGNGSYSYQWQTSADGTSWNDIPGANTASYTAVNLTASAYFQVIVTSNGISVSSGTASASVNTSDDLNWIRVSDILKPLITDQSTANGLSSNEDVHQTTQYFDGLGRLIQTVAKQATPANQDLVAPTVYDAFGREATKYLPYASAYNDGFYKLNALTDQNTFNSNQFPGEQY
jgi:hypothetical protein